jgi:hypothetical protein
MNNQITVDIGMLLNVGITMLWWTHLYSGVASVDIDSKTGTMVDSIYYNLNRKSDALQKQKHYTSNSTTTTKHNLHTRFVIWKNIKFNKELVSTLNLGFVYAVEYMSNINKDLEFKLGMEEDSNISYLYLSIHRGNHNL